MSTVEERIAQFGKMAHDDPKNEMAHFSLGSALLAAGRAAEAAKSFERCVELNPEMSKAYQLAGEAMIKAGWTDKAVAMLNSGYELAAARGDLMPRNAMADLLRSIGREPPNLSPETEAKAKQIEKEGAFICRASGRAGTRLPEPPMRGQLGKWIFENISVETWRAWIGQGTKVINELRLDFSREEDQHTYDMNMFEFLGIDENLRSELAATKAAR